MQRWKHTLYDWMKVSKVELAVMAELLLRGPQTEGELRARASRMEPLADLAALQAILEALAAKGLVQYLSPPGQKRGVYVAHRSIRRKSSSAYARRLSTGTRATTRRRPGCRRPGSMRRRRQSRRRGPPRSPPFASRSSNCAKPSKAVEPGSRPEVGTRSLTRMSTPTLEPEETPIAAGTRDSAEPPPEPVSTVHSAYRGRDRARRIAGSDRDAPDGPEPGR